MLQNYPALGQANSELTQFILNGVSEPQVEDQLIQIPSLLQMCLHSWSRKFTYTSAKYIYTFPDI